MSAQLRNKCCPGTHSVALLVVPVLLAPAHAQQSRSNCKMAMPGEELVHVFHGWWAQHRKHAALLVAPAAAQRNVRRRRRCWSRAPPLIKYTHSHPRTSKVAGHQRHNRCSTNSASNHGCELHTCLSSSTLQQKQASVQSKAQNRHTTSPLQAHTLNSNPCSLTATPVLCLIHNMLSHMSMRVFVSTAAARYAADAHFQINLINLPTEVVGSDANPTQMQQTVAGCGCIGPHQQQQRPPHLQASQARWLQHHTHTKPTI